MNNLEDRLRDHYAERTSVIPSSGPGLDDRSTATISAAPHRVEARRRLRTGIAVGTIAAAVAIVAVTINRPTDTDTTTTPPSPTDAATTTLATLVAVPGASLQPDPTLSNTPVTVAADQPQYSFMSYSKDSQGNGQLTFHFTNPVDAKPVGAVGDMSSAPHGQISYTQQDPQKGILMICGNEHFGLPVSTIDLLLPVEWFPTALRTDPHLSLSQGVDQFVADGVFGKVIGCPASRGLLQVSIVLANNPTADHVRVDAVRDTITVTVKR